MGETVSEVAPASLREEEPFIDAESIEEKIRICESQMNLAAKEWRFEEATKYRDELHKYQKLRILEEDL